MWGGDPRLAFRSWCAVSLPGLSVPSGCLISFTLLGHHCCCSRRSARRPELRLQTRVRGLRADFAASAWGWSTTTSKAYVTLHSGLHITSRDSPASSREIVAFLPDWGAFFSTRSATTGVAQGIQRIAYNVVQAKVPAFQCVDQRPLPIATIFRGEHFHHHPRLTEDESEVL